MVLNAAKGEHNIPPFRRPRGRGGYGYDEVGVERGVKGLVLVVWKQGKDVFRILLAKQDTAAIQRIYECLTYA